MSTIPVRNVYFLLCYAWNHVDEMELADVGVDDFHNVHDLLGHVLARAVNRIVSRRLDRSYALEAGAVAGIKGKLDVARTIQERTLWVGRTWCSFDEFRHDILQNQILKASLAVLLRCEGLDRAVRVEVRAAHDHLEGVQSIVLRQEHFRQVQIHRNNRLYNFALKVCRLLFDVALIDKQGGRTRFHEFTNDDARMAQIFEQFVFNFFSREQSTDRVARPHIAWYDARGSDEDLRYLPAMRTDIVLSRPERTLIIDTKYYADALKGRFQGERVQSQHLYQVLAYIDNLQPTADRQVEGMLLYPQVGRRFSFEYRLAGRRVRIVSLDLAARWERIHDDLLALPRVGESQPA